MSYTLYVNDNGTPVFIANLTETAARAASSVQALAVDDSVITLTRADGSTATLDCLPLRVGKASKLTTARTLQVDLTSTGEVSFDGSANASIGVSGILPVAYGGTGSSTGVAPKAAADASGNNIVATYATKAELTSSSDSKAPASHTSETATSAKFSHVKLSDATNSTSGASEGIAATPKAVNTAYNLASEAMAAAEAAHEAATASVVASATTPKAAGTAAVGTEVGYARGDHVHPAQTTISGNAGSATKLATARTIDGVSFDGSAAITHYGTCSTDAGTAAKTVSLTGFSLVTGAEVTVKFTVTNTAASPTLNVNSSGAKAIYYNGAAITAGYLKANKIYKFVYNGTQYDFIGDIDTNTTYTSGTGLSLSSNKFSLANTAVTSGAYGPSVDASPAHGGSFTVPYLTIDAQGRVTKAETKTITLPASGNTDKKVQVATNTTTKAYITASTSAATTGTLICDTGVYLDASAGMLTATTFKTASGIEIY